MVCQQQSSSSRWLSSLLGQLAKKHRRTSAVGCWCVCEEMTQNTPIDTHTAVNSGSDFHSPRVTVSPHNNFLRESPNSLWMHQTSHGKIKIRKNSANSRANSLSLIWLRAREQIELCHCFTAAAFGWLNFTWMQITKARRLFELLLRSWRAFGETPKRADCTIFFLTEIVHVQTQATEDSK